MASKQKGIALKGIKAEALPPESGPRATAPAQLAWALDGIVHAAFAADGRTALVSNGSRTLWVDLATRETRLITVATVHGVAATRGGLFAVLTSRQLFLVDPRDPDLLPMSEIEVELPSSLLAARGGKALIISGEHVIIAGVAGRELREVGRFDKKKTSVGFERDGRIFTMKPDGAGFEIVGLEVDALPDDPGAPVLRSDPTVRIELAPASAADAKEALALRSWKPTAAQRSKLPSDATWIARLTSGQELVVAWSERSGALSWLSGSEARTAVQALEVIAVAGPLGTETRLLAAERHHVHAVDLATGAVGTFPWTTGEDIVSCAWAVDRRIAVQTTARVILLDAAGAAELSDAAGVYGQGLVALRGGRLLAAQFAGRLDLFDTHSSSLRLIRSTPAQLSHPTATADGARLLVQDASDQWLEVKGIPA